MRSPYVVWRQKFIARHYCAEREFLSNAISAAAGYVFSLLFLCGFVGIGTHIFRHLDETIANEPFYEALLFSFTTITTIGYGKVVPKNAASRAFCVFYCVLGIPMAFLTLSHVGEFFTEIFWACAGSLQHKQKMGDFEEENRLPLKVVWTLLILHSLTGGLIFHYWIDEMPLISAIYFSFISITTIGFGDLNPTPDNGYHTIVLIVYLSIGIVVMSTLFGALSGHIRQYSKNLYANDVLESTPDSASNEHDDEWHKPYKASLVDESLVDDENRCAKNCSVNNYLCYKV